MFIIIMSKNKTVSWKVPNLIFTMVENPVENKSSCPDCRSLLWSKVIFEIALTVDKKGSTNQQKANISFEKKKKEKIKKEFQQN